MSNLKENDMNVRLMYGTRINVWKNLKRKTQPGPGG